MHKIGDLVLGLDWSSYENKNAARRAVKASKKLLLCQKALLNGDIVQGVVSGDKKLFDKKVYSGALIAASIAETVLIFLPLNDELVWFCAINNGEPIDDRVCDMDGAEDALLHTKQFIVDPLVIGVHREATASWEEFSEATPIKRGFAELKKPELSPAYVVVPLVILGIIGGGYYFVKVKEDEAIAAALAAAQQALSQEAARKEAERQQALADLVNKAKSEIFTHSGVMLQTHSWFNFIRSLPSSVEGWVPQKINCSPEQCTVEWLKPDLAPASQRSVLPGVVSATASADTASTQHAISAEKTLFFSDAPVLRDYIADVISVLPSGITLSVDAAAQPIIPTIPLEIRGQDIVPSIGRSIPFSMTASSAINLMSFIPKLNYPGVFVRSLSINNLKQTPYSVSIEGVMLERE